MKNLISLVESSGFQPDLLRNESAWIGHLPFAGWVVRAQKPKLLVELGSHWGHSYFAFCQSVKEAGLHTQCYAIDTWQGDEHAGNYGVDVFDQVRSHNSENYSDFSKLLRMTFDEGLSHFEANSIDLLHIDGLHTYEAVKHDFESWLPKLAPGAMVLFHDTVVKDHGFGVWKLWDELKLKYPKHIEFSHSFGLGVILVSEKEENEDEWLNPGSEIQKLIANYFKNLGSRQSEKHEANKIAAQLAETEAKLAETEVKLSWAEAQVNSIKSSISWKITAPLRIIFDLAIFSYKKAISVQKKNYTYQAWVKAFDQINKKKRDRISAEVDLMQEMPLISVLLPCYNSNTRWLAEAIDSVRNQLYPNWELCIADDASTKQEVRKLLIKYAESDSRIKVIFREQNGHISAASNSALAVATGEWIALLDHDDLLPEHTLYEVAKAINENPTARLIYSDEDKIDSKGRRLDPYFKPDWNPDLFHSQNFICHLGVYSKPIIDEIGGFREEFEGSQDYDLALRFIEQITPDTIHHIPRVLYHWRIHPQSTSAGTEAKPYAVVAGEKALNEHFVRVGSTAVAEWAGFGYRTRYQIPEKAPLVSIIIPTHNGVHFLRQCIASLLEKTDYSNYEILVIANRTDAPDALQYLEEVGQMSKIRVLRDNRPFNYSALNNSAVLEANGEILCFLNDDIEVISPEWLTEMVSHAIRPEIGAVGALLYYPDNTVQHAGVILGVGGVAGHAFKKFPHHHGGYMSRMQLIQNYSAVTAACLVVQKSVFEKIGGFDEVNLTVAFNDIDFCLKIAKEGYRNLWTPYAAHYHHESATRGYEDNQEKVIRFNKEIGIMRGNWGELLDNDPCYNPNLTMENEDFGLAWPTRVSI